MKKDIKHIMVDTETTGLSFNQGHKIIEIACVETINFLPTGREYHVYINPERDVPYVATKIHGIKTSFLKDKPKFRDIADDFLNFIGDDTIVAHNAPFDMGFINGELGHINRNKLTNEVIDTVFVARKQLPPGSKVSLDVLCNRFKISLESRKDHHSAIVDTRLLAKVFLELNDGKHLKLDLSPTKAGVSELYGLQDALKEIRNLDVMPSRNIGLPYEDEISKHEIFFNSNLKNALWASKFIVKKPGI
jgi:DNA polymerase-3 subunit epsilon